MVRLNVLNGLAFLMQILPVEDHALLQEYMGYCLLPMMPKHKMMWFYGGGRNGKGRVIATWKPSLEGKTVTIRTWRVRW